MGHIQTHALPNTFLTTKTQKRTIAYENHHTPDAKQVKMVCNIIYMCQSILVRDAVSFSLVLFLFPCFKCP